MLEKLMFKSTRFHDIYKIEELLQKYGFLNSEHF